METQGIFRDCCGSREQGLIFLTLACFLGTGLAVQMIRTRRMLTFRETYASAVYLAVVLTIFNCLNQVCRCDVAFLLTLFATATGACFAFWVGGFAPHNPPSGD